MRLPVKKDLIEAYILVDPTSNFDFFTVLSEEEVEKVKEAFNKFMEAQKIIREGVKKWFYGENRKTRNRWRKFMPPWVLEGEEYDRPGRRQTL